MKTLFWLTVGVSAGVTGAVMAGRWVRKQRQTLSPANVARQAGSRARDLGSRLGEATREFRTGMAERESEIRAAVSAG